MTKIEFLSASLPYQLKVKVLCGDGVFDTIDTLTIGNLYELGANRITPIVRPLSDLTKECVQADYNEGKPFVPIVELAKLLYIEISWTRDFTLKENRVQFDSYESANEFWYSIEHRCFMVTINGEDVPVHNQLQLFQFLLKWHFNLMDESVEVVNITDEFNPYR